MILKEMLAEFKNPRAAAQVAHMGMYMAMRWFERGNKRLIPPMHVLFLWAEHFELSDEELGELMRDAEYERRRMSNKLREKKNREEAVQIEVERNRLILMRDVAATKHEQELTAQAEAAEMADLDKNKEEFLNRQRRMRELFEKQSKILKELDK